MRLIDADELKKDIDGYDYSEEGYSDRMDFKFIYEVIDNQPAVQAKPVVHGEWIESKGVNYWFAHTCSICGEFEEFEYNFCPNCGADMRKKVE